MIWVKLGNSLSSLFRSVVHFVYGMRVKVPLYSSHSLWYPVFNSFFIISVMGSWASIFECFKCKGLKSESPEFRVLLGYLLVLTP